MCVGGVAMGPRASGCTMVCGLAMGPCASGQTQLIAEPPPLNQLPAGWPLHPSPPYATHWLGARCWELAAGDCSGARSGDCSGARCWRFLWRLLWSSLLEIALELAVEVAQELAGLLPCVRRPLLVDMHIPMHMSK